MTTESELKRIEELKAQILILNNELLILQRKHKIDGHCCRAYETSNGWCHDGTCKNWVMKY